MTKKRERTFWGFQHGIEVVRKYDKVICGVCTFCQAVGVTKIFSATSTVWIGEHLTMKYEQMKPSKTGNSTRIGFRLEKMHLTLPWGSAFLLITPEQVRIFKLKLIAWMVKKHISYSQVEDKDFREFIYSCSMEAISAEALLPGSENTI